MKIDYQNPHLVSKQVDFAGEMEDGREFTISAHWNDWDDWCVDIISWHDKEGTEGEEEQIINEFLANMI